METNSNFLNLKEVQLELKKMLKIVVDFLNENNIKYSIFYGTLLGAVRHEDFIPWDDDIDLVIERTEYEKLLNIIRKQKCIINENKRIEVIGFELGNSDWPFIKFINKNIEIIDDFKCDFNLWIDIFPLDYIKEKHNLYFMQLKLYRKLYLLRRTEKKGLPYNGIVNYIERKIVSIIDYNKLIEKYIKVCKKFEDEKCNLLCKTIWAKREIFIKEKFIIKEIKFGDLIVSGVDNYDYFLKEMYGDNYMDLPPENERITHLFKARRLKFEKK